MAASERVRALGLQVQVGDLVFLGSPDEELEGEAGGGDDELALSEAEGKVASIACVTGENINDSVHVVTEDDITANRFISTDVVLPLLGFNSMLPTNTVGPFIQNILDENDITLELFRKHPFFQFSGSYRRVFSRPGNFEWSTLAYSERNTDLVETELKDFHVKVKPDRKGVGGNAEKEKEEKEDDKDAVSVTMKEEEVEEKKDEGPPKYLAAVLKFSLPAGAYATMLLREVMKTSTDTGYHSGLSSSSASSSAQSILTATTTVPK